jgi:succinate-semialdehyde dehydrogenase/glutarate-semialdehyde dehydrogenase
MSLELGGCDPFVVFPGADLSAAVRALMGTRFYNAGQVCVAPKRLIVHRSVADTMIEMLSARIGRVVVGHGDEATTTMGPLHTSAVRDRLESQVADAVDLGATLIGGGRPDDAGHSGWYAQPGLLVDPPMGSRVRQEETFGPILSVIRVGETDEAVRTANETPYGLGASVWSGNNADALAVARQIRSGYTWINTIARVYDELPFGGVKDSGVGREHGAEALDSYLEDHTYVICAS